jgi:phage shock protein PspC (stress-responsive transcriptional regulator)/type II secretory pathway pseudopilin PulG
MRRPACGSIVVAMTETSAAPAAPRLLYRDPDDRMLAGVCAAIARYTGTDPVLWRIVVAVLTIFGGTGLLLYVIGWLLIPKRGDGSIVDNWLARHDRTTGPRTLAVLAIIGLLLLAVMDEGTGLAAIAVIAVVGYLVYRDRQGRPLAPAYAASAGTPPKPAADPADDPMYGPPVPPDWTVPGWGSPLPVEPRAPRERSRLGTLTLSIAALVTGTLVLARVYGVDSITAERVLAVDLLVVGAGLVVGTWLGRARWLALVGIALAIALAGTAAANGAAVGGAGTRVWLADSTQAQQDYRLGLGEATLDLTGVPATGRPISVDARIGVGHLVVIVPQGVPVRVHARVALGEVAGPGFDQNANGQDVERTASFGPPGDPQVVVDASVGTGQVEVRNG